MRCGPAPSVIFKQVCSWTSTNHPTGIFEWLRVRISVGTLCDERPLDSHLSNESGLAPLLSAFPYQLKQAKCCCLCGTCFPGREPRRTVSAHELPWWKRGHMCHNFVFLTVRRLSVRPPFLCTWATQLKTCGDYEGSNIIKYLLNFCPRTNSENNKCSIN